MYFIEQLCDDATNTLRGIHSVLRNRIELLPNYPSTKTTLSEDYLKRLLQSNGTKPTSNYVTFIASKEVFIAQQIKTHSANVNQRISRMTSAYGFPLTDSQSRSSKIKSILQDVVLTSALLLIEFQAVLHLGESHLLPPTILENHLHELQLHLSNNNLRIPFPINNHTVAAFYKLSTVHTFYENNTIFVSYELPIVQLRTFTLHYFIAYPRKVKGSVFQIFLSDLEYVAIDRRSNSYIHLNDDYLSKCKLLDAYTRICKLTEPIQSAYNSESCSVLLLTHAQLPRDCNFRMTNLTHELWLQLNELNSWLLVFPHNQKLSITCDYDVQHTKFITGTGILRLPQHCSAFTEYIELTSFEEISTATTYAQVDHKLL